MAVISTVGDIRKLVENLPDTAPVEIVFDVSTGEIAKGFVLKGAVETKYYTLQGTDVLMVELA